MLSRSCLGSSSHLLRFGILQIGLSDSFSPNRNYSIWFLRVGMLYKQEIKITCHSHDLCSNILPCICTFQVSSVSNHSHSNSGAIVYVEILLFYVEILFFYVLYMFIIFLKARSNDFWAALFRPKIVAKLCLENPKLELSL